MNVTGVNEELFFKKLKDIFIGVKIEGDSGFINLMNIKSTYFSIIFNELSNEINDKIKEIPDFEDFKEEMYDKLHRFFKIYFSESGSIYFSYTPFKSKIYEKVYTNQKDVSLFWKTYMLYYVKTDVLWKNLSLDYENKENKIKIHFDTSKLKHKSSNEKKEIVYSINKINGNEVFFDVEYSYKGKKTKIKDILKQVKKEQLNLSSDDLNKIFKIFKKQNEVDYFINKNANSFLKEQFDLYLKNYLFDDESDFSDERIRKLKILKDIAYKIIDFVSQFEDELVKIWNKPKFVLNSNYVLSMKTLKKIDEKKYSSFLIIIKELLEKDKEFFNEIFFILSENLKKPLENLFVREMIISSDHLNILYEDRFKLDLIDKKEIEKFIISKGFKFEDAKIKKGKKSNKDCWEIYLPNKTKNSKIYFSELYIDTKYLNQKQISELLLSFENLDELLDGFLIKSENLQALITLKNKFNKKIKMIYIDPPFKTGKDFDYIDKYLDSSWLTLMENRINLSKDFISKDGSFFLHLDENANYYGRMLMNEIFGKDNFEREICWNTGKITGYKDKHSPWFRQHDNIFMYSKSKDFFYNKLYTIKGSKKKNYPIHFKWLDLLYNKDGYYFERWYKNKLIEDIVNELKEDDVISLGNVWNDILNRTSTQVQVTEPFKFDTQKPENLLRRIIQSSTKKDDFILDYFSGSGTTLVVGHKLGRKWIGIEMGEHFNKLILPRIKGVLIGRDNTHLSEKINWQGGGFFKYYELEQYEQTLKKAVYEPSHPFAISSEKNIYQQYVFLKDSKMLNSMEIDYKNNKINIDFSKIYSNIDLPETLSNLTGKMIKKIEKNSVTFEDNSVIKFEDNVIKFDENNFNLIKPLIWW